MRLTLVLLLALLLWVGFAIVAAPPANLQQVSVVNGGGYFPVLIRLQSGGLLAVLRGGAPHVGVKGRLDIVRSADGGRSWSPPQTVVDSADDDRNPAFGQLRDGTILLGYCIARGYDETGLKFASPDRAKRIFDGVYLVRSRDGGKTWSQPERSEGIYSFYRGNGAISPYGKILQLADGTVWMSVYFEFFDGRGHEVYVFRSKDGGKTWGDPTLVGSHYNETALLELPDGRVLAAMRSQAGGHIALASSDDKGRTWSRPVQVTADREHPADLIRLKDGRILMTFGERNRPFGVHALLSADNGKSWDAQHPIVLADDAANIDCGYPSSVQLPDGRIVTMYYQVDDSNNVPTSAKAKAALWMAPKL
jgi:sialidase-1